MDHHVKDFFCQFSDNSPKGSFHQVLALQDHPEFSWNSISQMVPELPKGWYELAHLSVSDRIEFLRDYWLSKFPYHPLVNPFLTRFFDSLDDIGIYLTQRTYDAPFDANLIYSLQENRGFFRGSLPAAEVELEKMQQKFPNHLFPIDYLSFLRIHNGFAKTTDITGIGSCEKMCERYNEFQNMLKQEPAITTNRGVVVDPKTLVPFYESFGMPFFQCFWAEWYPEQEMGNVYYSGITKTISDVNSSDPSCEGMAFPTFVDWLMFYMEGIA